MQTDFIIGMVVMLLGLTGMLSMFWFVWKCLTDDINYGR